MSRSKVEGLNVNTVDAIAITPSEKSVICASYEEPVIRLHEIKTLKIIKTIQTRSKTICIFMPLSRKGDNKSLT